MYFSKFFDIEEFNFILEQQKFNLNMIFSIKEVRNFENFFDKCLNFQRIFYFYIIILLFGIFFFFFLIKRVEIFVYNYIVGNDGLKG